jgi:hypothetical protein
VTHFLEIAHVFNAANDFFHPFAQASTDGVARVAGGPAVNGRGTPRAVLGHMGCGIEGTQGLDKLPGVISFITAHGNAMPAGKLSNHALGRVPLGGSGAPVRRGVMISPWRVSISTSPHKTEFCLYDCALAEKPGLRVRGGGMGLVQAAFPMKVHFRIGPEPPSGRGVLGPETLKGNPGRDEGAVHRGMLVRQQSGLGRLCVDASEKGCGQVRTEKALPILGEDRMVPDLVVRVTRSTLAIFSTTCYSFISPLKFMIGFVSSKPSGLKTDLI